MPNTTLTKITAIQARTRELLYTRHTSLLDGHDRLAVDLWDIESLFSDAEFHTKHNGTWLDAVGIPLNEADSARALTRVHRLNWRPNPTNPTLLTSATPVDHCNAAEHEFASSINVHVTAPFFVESSELIIELPGTRDAATLAEQGYDAVVPLDYHDLFVLRPRATFDDMVKEAARWKGAVLKVARTLNGDKRAALRHSRMTTKGDLDAYLMAKFFIDPTTAREVSNELTRRNIAADESASLEEFPGEPWARRP